jgi:hypothetical protein
MLFSALLGSGEVVGRYRASAALAADQGQGLRVVLRIGSALLAGLPWEAMYDNEVGAYVCRHEQLVRHVPVGSVAAPLTVHPPLRILGVVSSPRGLARLDVEKEKEQLVHALSGLRNDDRAIVHWVPNATWAELHDLLLSQEWHVLHFIGHGDFDYERDEGVLALVGRDGRYDLVEATRLVDLLRQARPMPRLVVLNSCSGAALSTQDIFSGTAAALVRSGVSAVAAMQYEITDSAAVEFTRGFYSAIAYGRGIDDAISSGRVAILGTGARTLEWVTPVLYLRGDDSHLFTLAPINSSKSTIHRVSDGERSARLNAGPDERGQSETAAAPEKASANGPTPAGPLELQGGGSKVLEFDLPRGDYRMSWRTKGSGVFVIRDESARGGEGHDIVVAAAPNPDSGERMVRIPNSGHQAFSIQADNLTWQLAFLPLGGQSARPNAGPDERSQSETAAAPETASTNRLTSADSLKLWGRGSDVLETNLAPGAYRLNWIAEGRGYFGVNNESAGDGRGENLINVTPPNPDSGVMVVRIAESGPQVISVRADKLRWELEFRPLSIMK